MNKAVRTLISALLIALLGVVVAVFCMMSRDKLARTACNTLQIEFADSLRFVSEQEIRELLDNNYGQYIGQRIDSVGLAAIERMLDMETAIDKAQAWTTDDGILHVRVSQREPLLRFQDGSYGFYIDREGFIFPLHRTYTAPVTCIDGSIPVRVPAGYKGEAPDKESREWIRRMIALDRYIKGSRTLRNNVTGVHVGKNRDIYITLARGSEQFIIGQPDNLDSKFSRIEKYYSRIRPLNEEGYYSTVNVKYNNQIICRQKDI